MNLPLSQQRYTSVSLVGPTTPGMLFEVNCLHFHIPDHCLDTIRKFIMCRADVAMQTLHWTDDQRTPAHNFETEHECLNWEALDAWAASRMVDIHDPKILVHPTLGEYSSSNMYRHRFHSKRQFHRTDISREYSTTVMVKGRERPRFLDAFSSSSCWWR